MPVAFAPAVRSVRATAALAAVAAAVLVASVAVAPVALAADRVVSTVPAIDPPPQRGARVLDTRPQRAAGEARLAQDLERQAELNRLFNPHLDAGWGATQVYPSVFPQVVAPWPPACVPPRCPSPGGPVVRPVPLPFERPKTP